MRKAAPIAAALAAALAGAGGAGADEKSSVTLATADTAIEVRAEGARLDVARLGAPGGGDAWTAAASAFPLIDTAYVQDKPRPLRWNHEPSTEKVEEGKPVRLRFTCADPALELVSEWTAYPGPGPIEHTIRITNKTAQDILLPLQKSLVLTLQAPAGHALEALSVEKGAGRPSDVGVHPEPIAAGYLFEGRSRPYSGDGPDRDRIPWLSVHDATANRGFYVGVEFTGRVLIALAADADRRLTLDAAIDPAGNDFRTRVPPGGAFETPTVFVGCFAGDHDDGANRLHRFVETRLRPPVTDPRYPFIVNNSWGSGMAVDEELARRMIDDAAAMGVEIFHIDAGWFQGVGDWHPHRDKFPHGLAPIGDYVRKKGMLFGLWTGWTQGGSTNRGLSTLAVNNPLQREWFTRDYPPTWRPNDFTGADVCLGCDAARAWCLGDLRRMVKEFKLDLLEHDQRMVVDHCNRQNHRHENYTGDVSYHAALGYYGVYDQLRKENPKLIFEDCVNGGRMVDFGVVRRVHYISITDSYDPLSNRRAIYDAGYPLPPAMGEAYIANHPGPTLGTFRYMLRSGMMGWCTLMCDTSKWNAEQHVAAKRQIKIYKDVLRPLINAGNVYHVSPRPDGVRWDGLEYFNPKTKKGVLYAFRGKTDEPQHAYKLKGLRPEAMYKLRFEDKTSADAARTGARLASEGLTVRLLQPESSELVYIEEQ